MRSYFAAAASIIMSIAISSAAISCSSNSSNSSNQSTQLEDMKSKVLVVVDVQRDFFDPSGSLYVGGSEVLPGKIAAIADSYDAVIFTLDWHPGNHCSFAASGRLTALPTPRAQVCLTSLRESSHPERPSFSSKVRSRTRSSTAPSRTLRPTVLNMPG